MGGFGSGRRTGGGRLTVESARAIDVNWLHRRGCLAPGWSGRLQWTEHDEVVASIDLRADVDRLHLGYRIRLGQGGWDAVDEDVAFVRVPCGYGGSRPYLVCPGMRAGVACGRRVIRLHGAGRYFLCRRCYDLSYASQSENVWDRALRRAGKIRQRLGGENGPANQFPERPKGMWQSTYERLRHAAVSAEMRIEDALQDRIDRLEGRLNRLDRKRRMWR